MFNSYYGIYQAERPKSAAELRASDAGLGQFAAGIGQLRSMLASPGRVVRRSLRRWRPAECPAP